MADKIKYKDLPEEEKRKRRLEMEKRKKENCHALVVMAREVNDCLDVCDECLQNGGLKEDRRWYILGRKHAFEKLIDIIEEMEVNYGLFNGK